MVSDMNKLVMSHVFAGTVLGSLAQIPYREFALFILRFFFQINQYTITNALIVTRLQKRMLERCTELNNNQAFGYAWGSNYLMRIYKADGKSEENGSPVNIVLICSKKTYDRLTVDVEDSVAIHKDQQDTSIQQKDTITICTRSNYYNYPDFDRRQITVHSVRPTADQSRILAKIQDAFQAKSHIVALLHGPPGTGKTIIGMLLAKTLKGTYSNSLRPWEPNNGLAALYACIQPSASDPLIINMDEFDTSLIKIHEGTIQQSKHVRTEVANKSGWNHMFDEIQRGMYPHVILLLTTNRTPDFIRGLDPSYIRKGRVDMIETLEEMIQED